MDIDQMPAGRELDLRVAKIMGWWWDDKTAHSPTGSRHARTGQSLPFWWLPCYSTDIRAAWKIALRFADVRLEKGAECYAFLSDVELGQGRGIADSMPLAVCRAALKVMAEGQE